MEIKPILAVFWLFI